jgi:hypothetical protein
LNERLEKAMGRKNLLTKTVEIEFEGRTVTGRYAIDRRVVQVRTAYGSKATQTGGLLPAVTARRLLYDGRRLIRKLLLEEEQKEVPFQTPSPPTARSRYLWH